jgi:hypothetical protein
VERSLRKYPMKGAAREEDSRFRGNDGVGAPAAQNVKEDSRFRGNDGVGRLASNHVMLAKAGIFFCR